MSVACPYCQEEFENKTEEGIHRAKCPEANFLESGSGNTNRNKKKNIIDEYKRKRSKWRSQDDEAEV